MDILLIEDEQSLLVTIRNYLESQGYVLTTATTLQKAILETSQSDYNCVIVDIGLPDGSGLDLVRQLKERHSKAGIIIISARNSLEDKLTGLELGSDDYLTKPFDLPELNARIKSLLRRVKEIGNTPIEFGAITIYPLSHKVHINSHPANLTQKEYALLLYFVSNPDRLLDKYAIARHMWGNHMDLANSHEFLYNHIKNLRKKLIDQGAPDYLKTKYGVGYIFSTRI